MGDNIPIMLEFIAGLVVFVLLTTFGVAKLKDRCPRL